MTWQQRLVNWFAEQPQAPPFPAGTLLFYSFNADGSRTTYVVKTGTRDVIVTARTLCQMERT